MASAQDGGSDDVPGVALDPVGTGTDDPNDGQWFVTDAEPGSTVELEAGLFNLADVEQDVVLYVVDLQVADDGTPQLGQPDAGMGTWATFERTSFTVAARERLTVSFRLTVPPDADHGDHLGAVAVESAPSGRGDVQVVKRTASRLYVTVPGEADPALEIESVRVRLDRPLLARQATITVELRNTGNVRLAPDVRIGGRQAEGSDLLMSSSSETYELRRSVPLWGGRLRWPIEVTTRTLAGAGPSATDEASRLVFPWWVLLALLLLVIGVLSVRELRRRLSPRT